MQTFMESPSLETPSRDFKSWVVVFTAALFFFYEFIQGNMFNSIATDMMREFGLGAPQLGWLTGTYFIANVVFLFPAGNLLDRFSTRKIILTAMVLTVVGTYALTLVHSFEAALMCRFITGIGAAFCFLSCIRLASRWFPPHKMAFITGLIVTMAMTGGLAAQTPMTYVVMSLGWRHAILTDAVFGILIIGMIWAFVEDYPHDSQRDMKQQAAKLDSIGLLSAMRQSYFNLHNILAALYTSLMNAPIAILGGMAGSLFLMQVYHMPAIRASYASSAIFIGTIVGGPIVGKFSDMIGRRRLPMIIGAVLSANAMWLFIHAGQIGISAWSGLFFLIGLLTSTQVLSYPMVAESNPPMLTATAVSVVSILTQGGIALYQPLFGFFLKQYWNGDYSSAKVPLYSALNYHHGFLMLLFGILIALGAALALRETFGKQQQ